MTQPQHTASPTVLAKAIEAKIRAKQGELGIADVFYGFHNMIARSPTVVVQALGKSRQLAGVAAPGGRTMNELTVTIDVMSAAVGDEASDRLALEQLADKIETELHKDPTMGGILIHGFVTDWDNGEMPAQGGSFRLITLTYRGQTKTYLSPPS